MILKIDGPMIVLFSAFGAFVYWLHHFVGFDVNIPLSVIATLGTAVAILLGFKNNSAYDRWWEARKIWGGIVNQSRFLSSQLITYVDKGDQCHSEEHQQLLTELVNRHLAYINVLRLRLRELPTNDPIKMWLSANELDRLGFELQGKAERIKNTPLMRHYSYFTTAFVWVFVLFLPFGFVAQMDWKMIPLFVLVSTIFTMLDRAGTFTETPFDNSFNDVAMDAICRTIEIDMLQQIGDREVPDTLVAVDGILM